MGTDDVACFSRHLLRDDIGLFIPVCVQLHASLLHQHAAVVFLFTKRNAGKITLHGCLLELFYAVALELPVCKRVM